MIEKGSIMIIKGTNTGNKQYPSQVDKYILTFKDLYLKSLT